MRTPWGYDVDYLEPIISETDFHTMTGDAYVGNPRVGAAVAAASMAVRNYCGWHICPSMSCEARPAGGAIVAKLPAGYVSEIEGITENGTALSGGDYEWRRDGLIKRAFPYKWTDKWDGIEVSYKAGYDIDAVPDLAEAVCAIVSGVLSVTAGVTSESADGVSISYSKSASSIAAGLTEQQQTALAAYKVVSSHGA